jgi:cell division protein FtsI (penicillin-binding protein 3)
LAAAPIANGGNLMEPIVISKVTTASGEIVRESAPRVRRRVISRRVARSVAEMLVAVTEGDGTGIEAAIEGYRVAGKTATAQKTDSATGRYSLDKYIASFVGFVPATDPVVAIAVTIDEPMVDHAGGSVAAPVFRRVAEMVLKYHGLRPRDASPADLGELAAQADPARAMYELLRQAEGKKPPVQEIATEEARPGRDQVQLPDMTGWPMREAMRRSIELGVAPHIEGSGLLARQVPGPGRVLKKGERLLLVFEPSS